MRATHRSTRSICAALFLMSVLSAGGCAAPGLKVIQPSVTVSPAMPALEVVAAPHVAFDSEELSLDEIQDMALANNPTIVQAQAQISAAQGAALQAGLPPNPNIGYVAEQIGLNDTAGELQGGYISQEFVRGNKLSLSRQKYCQRVQIARTNFLAQQTRVRNDVATRFYHALAAQRLVEIHQRLVDTAADNVQTHREMLNLGQLGEAEVLQAEVELQGERRIFNYLPRDCLGFMIISYFGRASERSSLALMTFISALGTVMPMG